MMRWCNKDDKDVDITTYIRDDSCGNNDKKGNGGARLDANNCRPWWRWQGRDDDMLMLMMIMTYGVMGLNDWIDVILELYPVSLAIALRNVEECIHGLIIHSFVRPLIHPSIYPFVQSINH